MNYFGPFQNDYCFYFQLVSMFSAFSFLLSLIALISYILFNSKKLNNMIIINGFMTLLNLFFIYFVNRLLFTICVSSLR